MISLFLVEDERIARESIRDNVPWQEHDILFLGDAPDGEVALPQLLEKRPDILLTDIKMPFMDRPGAGPDRAEGAAGYPHHHPQRTQ